jgi:glycosyltransferase involved in cell wall biosynthesis
MTEPLDILVIAPYAPPKNTAESIQIWRIMQEFDKHARGRLVKIMPRSTSTWEPYDASLELDLQHFETQLLVLPLHALTTSVLMSHRFARFHVPDSSMWIQWMAGRAIRGLKARPDVIYSRASPMSASLLAARVKEKLGVPWVMHLSDPWADSPYKPFDARDAAYERECFTKADLIALTTQGQAEYYRNKYPDYAQKIFVSPNVMPVTTPRRPDLAHDGKLHLVYAGRLYGSRSPKPLMEALAILRRTQPHVLAKLRIDVYGLAQAEALALLKRAPDVVHYHGHVPFAEANAAQNAADVMLTIEPDSDHILAKATLASKIMDCMAQGQPILAIAPVGSETEHICRQGYGWAVSPCDPQALSTRLAELVARVHQLRYAVSKEPLQAYAAPQVVQELLQRMHGLSAKALAA